MENGNGFVLNKDSIFEESVSILEDYIYSNRACYFIDLTSLEEEILLFYSKNTSLNLDSIDFSQSNIFDADIFVFLSKLLQVAYHYADGLIVDIDDETSVNNHKTLIEITKSDAKLIDRSALNDLKRFEYVLLGKKILWITSNEDKLNLNNVSTINVDLENILSSKNWVEEFDALKMKVMIQEFDVAFVNVGILSTPLCYFISQNLHKIAIVKGGKNV